MAQNARASALQNSGTRQGPRDVLALIGQTPLLRLQRVGADFPGVEFYAKAEWANPGGSVKDRPAMNIIREAERAVLMSKDKILIDSTSGNTGIAYAMICAARGYRLKLCMPSNVSEERKRILKAYGTEIIYTDPLEGSDGAIRRVRQMAAEKPELYFYANQYDNPANWRAHYNSTGPEIFEQTQGRVTHFVAGLGTSGTFVGTARRLKELHPRIQCVSLQPDAAFHGLEGWKHMGSALVPAIYDPRVADRDLVIRTEDAYLMAKRLAREEAMLVSPSAAAAFVGCLQLAASLGQGERAVIVTIFPDAAEKYLSERFWDESEGA